MMTLGQVIRLRRNELGLTQEELAERVGVGVRQAEISRLERDGVSLPRRQRLEQLAQALDMPLGLLLARSGWSGAEAEFLPAAAADDAEQSSGVAVLEHKVKSDPLEFRIAANNRDVPHLQDAMSRAEEVMHRTESVMQEAQATYDQARQSLAQRRRRKGRLEGNARS